tara:strand:- start:18309 stop:19943 length:1635 start_codon:yes stop_codon:yes gene_type:complete
MVKKLSIGSFALCGLFFSSVSLAVCPPIIPCNTVGTAKTIVGSNADIKLAQLSAKITTDTNAVAQAIIDGANANVSAMQTGTNGVVSSFMEMGQINLDTKMKQDKAMLDGEMDFMANQAETDYRASVGVVSADDTKEEFDLILKYLQDYSAESVPKIIYLLRETYDNNPEGVIGVPIKTAEGTCTKEQISEEGLCTVPKKIFPAAKLEVLYKQCGVAKKVQKQQLVASQNKATLMKQVSDSADKAAAVTDSAGAVSGRLAATREQTCSPSDFKKGLCRVGMSFEEYQTKLMIGAIVPQGDVLASNFASPSKTYVDGYIDDLSDDAREDIEAQSLDRTPLDNNPEQRVVDLVDTYRNASQVRSAMSFIDNIVGEDLVSNAQAGQRRNFDSSEAQAQYLSRMAALSMARTALTESMVMRLGDKMRDAMQNDEIGANPEITIDSVNNKEFVTGASEIDILRDRVQSQFDSFLLSSETPSEGSTDFVNNPSPTDTASRQLDSLVLANELMFRRYLVAEQKVNLSSVQLSQLVNSPQFAEALKKLRRTR